MNSIDALFAYSEQQSKQPLPYQEPPAGMFSFFPGSIARPCRSCQDLKVTVGFSGGSTGGMPSNESTLSSFMPPREVEMFPDPIDECMTSEGSSGCDDMEMESSQREDDPISQIARLLQGVAVNGKEHDDRRHKFDRNIAGDIDYLFSMTVDGEDLQSKAEDACQLLRKNYPETWQRWELAQRLADELDPSILGFIYNLLKSDVDFISLSLAKFLNGMIESQEAEIKRLVFWMTQEVFDYCVSYALQQDWLSESTYDYLVENSQGDSPLVCKAYELDQKPWCDEPITPC